MRPQLHQLEALVRSRICRECELRAAEGICNLQEPGQCKLFELFPLVAQAILATESDKIQDYVAAIREHVCSACLEQALDGSCALRGQVRCALDSYLPQIVEVIEEATGRKFSKQDLMVGGWPPVGGQPC